MKNIIKYHSRIKRYCIMLVVLFAFVFLLRWVYEFYFSGNDIIINYNANSNYLYEAESMRKTSNVATDQISQKGYSGELITIDQKYEKTADISAVTSDFNQDNQQLRQIIDENEAVIQMENLHGLEGNQVLSMTIGVMPHRFDAIVESIRGIGDVKSFTVNKVDKTSEFNYLMAEMETLQMTRDSYAAIKEKGGNIQDLLLLEEKILEVEKSMQELGVNLGSYSSENSFCTINFTLQEVARQSLSVRFMLTCAKRSLFWTLGAFALGLFIILIGIGMVAVILALSVAIKKSAAVNAEYSEKKTDNHSEELNE